MELQEFTPLAPADAYFGNSGISVRKQDAQHAEFVFEKVQAQKERLQEFLSWPIHINTLEDQLSFSRKADIQWAAGQAYHFQIFKEEVFAGAISIHSLNYQTRSFEFGYWVDSEYEGKGLVQESLLLLIKAMAARGWRQAIIRTNYQNIRSQTVAQKLGMTLLSQTDHFRIFSANLESAKL
ncbi:GNAT family N-acetyltransferase [Bdellovibrio bacteriovorus]|uniref:GNAT family N-acetyltransferase n=1 Tax=Bdellovibrio bacteriovorus TaxID=959 RepID=UPI0035A576DC